jgi:hypothetical protein
VKLRRVHFDLRQARRPVLAALAVWLLLNVGFFLVFVGPKLRAYHAQLAESEPQFEALARRESEVEIHESFRQALEDVEDAWQHIRTDVLSTRARRLVDVQRELATICGQFQIDLETIRFENKLLPAESLERFGMVVPLQGGYSALRRFLEAVERSDKYLLVERVALGQNREGGKLLELNITLATYFDAPEDLLRAESRAARGGSG